MMLRALTLVEVLAATVILAAAASAMALVARDANRSAREAALARDALVAFERWRDWSIGRPPEGAVPASGAAEAGGEWLWVDPTGREWRVVADPPRESSEPDGARIAWSDVRVEVAESPASGFTTALTLRRLALAPPPPPEATPEAPPESEEARR